MPSPWIEHVKQFRAQHPGMSYAEALKSASSTYSGKPTSGGSVKTVVRKAKNTAKKIARKTINTIDNNVVPVIELTGTTVAPEVVVPYEAAKLAYKGSKLLKKKGGSFKVQGGSFMVQGAGHAHAHGCSECGMKKPLCGSGFSKDFPKKPKTLYDEIHGY
jgi:hypothetical protein